METPDLLHQVAVLGFSRGSEGIIFPHCSWHGTYMIVDRIRMICLAPTPALSSAISKGVAIKKELSLLALSRQTCSVWNKHLWTVAQAQLKNFGAAVLESLCQMKRVSP